MTARDGGPCNGEEEDVFGRWTTPDEPDDLDEDADTYKRAVEYDDDLDEIEAAREREEGR